MERYLYIFLIFLEEKPVRAGDVLQYIATDLIAYLLMPMLMFRLTKPSASYMFVNRLGQFCLH